MYFRYMIMTNDKIPVPLTISKYAILLYRISL